MVTVKLFVSQRCNVKNNLQKMNFRFHLAKGHKMKRVVSERKKDIRTCIYVNIYAALIGNV